MLVETSLPWASSEWPLVLLIGLIALLWLTTLPSQRPLLQRLEREQHPFMTLPRETMSTGAPTRCESCRQPATGPLVLESGAGFFIGMVCCCPGGVYSRESVGYWSVREEAEQALGSGMWRRRDAGYHGMPPGLPKWTDNF